MIKAFVFDMDGTIADSMPLWRMTNREVLEKYSYPIDSELESRLVTLTSWDVAGLLKEAGLAERDEVSRLYVELMLVRYMTVVKAKPGIEDFLILLRESGVRVFLASATPVHATEKALEKLGLLQYFERLFDDTSFGMHKGNPEFFTRLSAEIEVPARDCAMFEDSLYAARSAKAAGYTVYAIKDETADKRPEMPEGLIAESDVYVTDFFEACTQFVNNQ